MSEPTYILVHDIGTTANKTSIFKVEETLSMVSSKTVEYPLYTLPNGGVEQHAEELWRSIVESTKAVMQQSNIPPEKIKSIVFCAQMVGFLPVDKEGNALRPIMNYLDSRAIKQIEKYLYHGLIRIDGKWNLGKTLRTLRITGGLAGTAKDPLWKYHWVKDNEPEIYEAMHKWLDVKDYLVLKATGNFTMGVDSAHLTFIYDTRKGKLGWHEGLAKLYDVNMDHLPETVNSTEKVGELTKQTALEFGLNPGIPVYGGGGDLSCISVGSGALDEFESHIYIGTSGWVSTNVDKRMTDINGFIASILGAIPDKYNYIAEQETSGRCLQWVRDHLAMDEIGLYMGQQTIADVSEEERSLYDLLNQEVMKVEPGSGGVIYAPWLHGNRAPKEDPYVRSMFFNIGLDTGKRQMIRSVLEGVAFHKRWMLERVEKRLPYNHSLRLLGGGAQSDVWAQIIADVTGRQIEVIENPQNGGAVGAAVIAAVGMGLLDDFSAAKKIVKVEKVFVPQKENKKVYDDLYNVFLQLYKNNHKLFKQLNSGSDR